MPEATANEFVEHVREFFPHTETVPTREETSATIEDEWVDIDALTSAESGTTASPDPAEETDAASNTCDFQCEGEVRTGTVQ
jgi:hypothetical protein